MLTLEELHEIAEKHGNILVPMIEILKAKAINVEPVDVFEELRKSSKYSFLLESAIFGEKIARYSFLGRASNVIRLKDYKMEINGKKEDADLERILSVLRNYFKRYYDYEDKFIEIPKFFGGLIGYISYDFVRYFEEIELNSVDDLRHADMEFMIANDVIAFDHWRNEIYLIANIELEGDIYARFKDAKRRINDLKNFVVNAKKKNENAKNEEKFGEDELKFTSNFRKEDFLSAVKKAKEYIFAGDIFQVVLSQRFECKYKRSPIDIYRRLKKINPSPYMYFLDFGDLKIIGSSPEILVRVEGKKVVTRPIAGTRPRSGDIVEDEELARELLNDEKERAEHVMLVDLGRNDIGKVSKFGSVRVTEFMTIEKYSHVQHIVSNVEGELRDGKDCLDALLACFPAGTVSGAPKIRAMEIIDELEPSRRGIYSGAIGYICYSGNIDMAITIRTIIIDEKMKKAYIQAGAGIVADSVPEREYEETLNKGKALLHALFK